MKIGNTTKIDKLKCLDCGENLDLATSTTAEHATPSPGDVSVCVYCGNIAAFEDYGLRHLTSSEMYEIAGDERVLAAQKNRQWVVDEVRKKTYS